MNRVLKSTNNALRGVADRVTIARLSEEALATAIAIAEKQVRREFKHVNNAVVDASHKFDPLTNTDHLVLSMKQPNGDPFRNRETATYWARHEFKLGSYKIVPEGVGFRIETTRPIDETVAKVQDVLINDHLAKTPKSWVNASPLGWLRGADDLLSPEHRMARKTAIHGIQKVLNNMREVLRPVMKLSRGSKRDLNRFLMAMRDHLATGPDGKPLKGSYFDNLGEFEQAWYMHFQRFPTEKEATAYFSFVKHQEMDYLLRNLAVYRDKARQGISQFSLRNPKESKSAYGTSFEGRVVDIDLNSLDGRTGILIWDPVKGISMFHSKEQLKGKTKKIIKGMTEEGESHLPMPGTKVDKDGVPIYRDEAGRIVSAQSIKDELAQYNNKNYKIVQVASPYARPLKDQTGVNDIINFVIVKDYKNSPIPFEQIPWQPGGRAEFDYNWHIKQPRIAQMKDRKVYFGDTSVRGVQTERDAHRLATNYERARQLLRAKQYEAFDDLVRVNLPHDPAELRKAFADGELSLDHPIVPVHKGQSVPDHAQVKDHMSGAENALEDKYNLMRNLSIVDEQRPLFQIDNADAIDPISMMSRANMTMARNVYLNDYRIYAAEHFVEEFHEVLNVPLKRLRENPLAYILDHNEHWLEGTPNKLKLEAARKYKAAVRQMLGVSTPVQRVTAGIREKLYDAMYHNLGQKTADLVDEKLLASIDDPVRFIRSVVFVTKLGLFNPVQLWKQAQTLGLVMSIAHPVAALKAAPTYFLSRALMMSKESDQMVAHFARMATAFGWKQEHFIEAYRAMRKAGIDIVEGEHAWKDNMIDIPIFSGKGGQFFNKSAVFFTEGERTHRLVGFMAAYQEWRMRNPFKEFNDRALHEVLLRQDTLSVNMTKASNSSIEKGIFTIPQQFMSYQIRLFQLFTSGRLTKAETARALTTMATLYGVPVGVLGTMAGVWPWYEDIKESAQANGITINDNFAYAFHNGLVELGIKLATGVDTNFAENYGPAGLNVLKDIWNDGPTLDILSGASGSTLGNIIKTTWPIIYDIGSIFDDGMSNEKMTLLAKDFEDLARNISSVNNAYLTYYGINLGKYIAKGEVYLDEDISTFESIMMGVFGIAPERIDTIFYRSDAVKDYQGAELEARQQIIKYLRRGIEADTEEQKLEYFRMAKMWRIMGGIRPDQWTSIYVDAAKGYETLLDRVNERMLREAPQDVREPVTDMIRQESVR